MLNLAENAEKMQYKHFILCYKHNILLDKLLQCTSKKYICQTWRKLQT